MGRSKGVDDPKICFLFANHAIIIGNSSDYCSVYSKSGELKLKWHAYRTGFFQLDNG